MVDRHELLRRPIKSLGDAKRWIEELSALELSFHFEDDPSDIVIGLSGVALFSDEEAVEVRRRQAELYSLKWPEEFQCPIGYLLHVEGHLYE
jgi:hypothetical protein